MDRYAKLEQITGGLNAVNKMRKAVEKNNSQKRDDSPEAQRDNSMCLIKDILNVIGEYSSSTRQGGSLINAVGKCDSLSCTYKDLKNHLRTMDSRGPSGEGILKTLDLIRPALDSKSKTTIEKMLKIIEIINS